MLESDLERLVDQAYTRDLIPLFRPNVASDLDWSGLAEAFPNIRFYDYTKVRSRLSSVRSGKWPANYELTYSVSERSHHRTLGSYLRAGRNVAAVFDTEYVPSIGRIGDLPDSWRLDGRQWSVVDGDLHDIRLREVDGAGVIVGLRFKGSRRLLGQAIERGFVYRA